MENQLPHNDNLENIPVVSNNQLDIEIIKSESIIEFLKLIGKKNNVSIEILKGFNNLTVGISFIWTSQANLMVQSTVMITLPSKLNELPNNKGNNIEIFDDIFKQLINNIKKQYKEKYQKVLNENPLADISKITEEMNFISKSVKQLKDDVKSYYQQRYEKVVEANKMVDNLISKAFE